MSLINKMLQDLDARGGAPSGPALAPTIKPVARAERRVPLWVAIGVPGALLAAAVGAVLGWRYYQRPAPPVAVIAAPAAPLVVAPPPPGPVVATVSMPVPLAAAAARQSAPARLPPVPAKPPAARKDAAPRTVESRQPEVPRKPDRAPAASSVPAPAPAAADADRQQPAGRQSAEREYRRALAGLQEGRVGEAIAGLEQTLQLDARHDAARQTLVGLLIENRRVDDAMRQLQLGLALDARQPALAMLLARLQIERGGSGVDTLLRTLPHVAGNGDYHAFLGGALQRQQRHREAAEQYQAALRINPQNAVWLMGQGISLQADKRDTEALDAFQKARASATLSPELQAFVERKLQQLSR